MKNEDISTNSATDAQSGDHASSPDERLIKALASKCLWWCCWLLAFLPFNFADVTLEQFRNFYLAGMPGILILWSAVTAKNLWRKALICLLLIPSAFFCLITLQETIWSNLKVDRETTVGTQKLRDQTRSWPLSLARRRELVQVSPFLPGIEIHRKIGSSDKYWILWRKIDDRTIEWQETGFENWRDDLPKTLVAL